eukprot:365810-Pyramimonas_sp.AAC.1
MPPPLTRLVRIDRICPLSSPDWSTWTECALQVRIDSVERNGVTLTNYESSSLTPTRAFSATGHYVQVSQQDTAQ